MAMDPLFHVKEFISLEECRAICLEELPSLTARAPHQGEGQRIELTTSPRRAIHAARRAFREAAAHEQTRCSKSAVLSRLSNESTRLMVQAVVYGVDGVMKRHVDATVGRAPKYLAILSLGLACDFGANSVVLELRCGDMIVFDASTVLHGVERIKRDTSPLLDQIGEVRVSMMFWEAPPDAVTRTAFVDGPEEPSSIASLFNDYYSDD